MVFYDKVNELMEMKKIKKSKMCEDLGIPYTSLMSAFSRKSKSISIDVVEAIANYLEVSVDYLIRKDITDTQYGIGRITTTNECETEFEQTIKQKKDLTKNEQALLENYNALNLDGQDVLLEQSEIYKQISRYKKNSTDKHVEFSQELA